jgi:hypothetical protein
MTINRICDTCQYNATYRGVKLTKKYKIIGLIDCNLICIKRERSRERERERDEDKERVRERGIKGDREI